MKKVLKLAMALAMAASLVGCGGSSTTSDDSDQFIVGMEVNYAPFNWSATEESDTTAPTTDGVSYADGYDVQIAKLIAEDMGKELVVKKLDWDGLIPALESGEIDAIIAGMTATDEREEGADFTTPYFDGGGLVMIVNKDSKQASYTKKSQFKGQTVIGQKDTAYDTAIDQIEGVDHATPLKTYPELVVALQNNDVVGITAEMPVAMGICQANDDLTYIEFDEDDAFDYDSTVSIGLKEGSKDSELFKAVQSALDKISDSKRKELMADCVSRAPTGD